VLVTSDAPVVAASPELACWPVVDVVSPSEPSDADATGLDAPDPVAPVDSVSAEPDAAGGSEPHASATTAASANPPRFTRSSLSRRGFTRQRQ
jgi:hypothetical protein